MEKMIRNRKGFSLVELLVALLILAVIIAAALTMMGGVLQAGTAKADGDAADAIATAIENYIHTTGDRDLAVLKVDSATTTTTDLATALTGQIEISDTAATWYPYDATNKKISATSGTPGTTISLVAPTDTKITRGTLGPFLDGSKAANKPQQKGYLWKIEINRELSKAYVSPIKSTSETVTLIN